METLLTIFGEGKDLSILQMCSRGIIVFFLAFLLIRLSGRRSFGIHTALDNIIVILLGATLSRGIVGASPFVATLVTCTVITALHRLFGWLIVRYHKVGLFIEGDKLPLYEHGKFNKKNMDRALVSEAEVMQGIRRTAITDDLDQIKVAYLERSGEISAVRK
ncbi:DUF421 domain-containing protein [Mucilaginibacter sp. HC2]|uniref:DUF421 domain-containing protein n=1 Tax=Mucilaginibacter inviolabilis TaxID=2714892 RepID=UPI00140E42D4|nr:YetF domain-containing protein [Mucilaginibacter inviolabilis]NHA02694.1 DUF421 domain-containing protein [Mucilaginibacter inviolabilis]